MCERNVCREMVCEKVMLDNLVVCERELRVTKQCVKDVCVCVRESSV